MAQMRAPRAFVNRPRNKQATEAFKLSYKLC